MGAEWVVLQRYGEYSAASADCGLLEEAGFAAQVNEEVDEDSETGVIYALRVHRGVARKAYDLLSEHYEKERYETLELMGDWDEAP